MAGLVRSYFKKSEDISSYDALHQKDEAARVEKAKEVATEYYDLATDIYLEGWGQSFHFAPRYRGESFEASIAREEHWLALQLGLKPGMRILDVGCGVGGPQRSIARFSGAQVTGLNINKYQLSRARELTEKAGLTKLCSYLHGDFHHIPAEDNTFDGAYQFEATCHASDLARVYGEICRVLKPGCMFGSFEWCCTDKFDLSNPEHQDIKKRIEEGNGLPTLYSQRQVLQALRDAGFEVLVARDVSLEQDLPWYNSLATTFSFRDMRFTKFGRWAAGLAVRTLETLRIAPRGVSKLHAKLALGANALVEAGQKGLFTVTYFTLARKPLPQAGAASSS